MKKQQFIHILAIAVITVLTFCVYGQLSDHRFLNLDDTVYVTANSHVKNGLAADSIIWAFTTLKAEFWHPVTWLSYMTDTTLFGVQPGGYLFTNLLLHLLNSILLFYFFYAISGRSWKSGLIAALFAIHPLHVEPVAWISQRKELLSAFFWILTMLFYIRYARKPGFTPYIAVCFCFLLGLMAKPMIVTLPFVLLLLDYWPLHRFHGVKDKSAANSAGRSVKELVYEKIPLIFLSIAFSLLTLMAQNRGGGLDAMAAYSFSERLANAVFAYAEYLKKVLWPVDLAVFYPFNPDLSVAAVTVSLVILLVISGLCIAAIKRFPYLIVGWLWFLGTLVPVIGVIKIGDFAMADRYVYIPLIGIFIIMVFGLGDLIRPLRLKSAWLLIIPAFLLANYCFLAHHQVGTWKNSQTLYWHALKVTTDNFFAHHGLGSMLAANGYMKEAIYHFSKAAAIRPEKATFQNKIGRALVAKNKWNKATRCFQKAVEIDSDYPASHFLLGCALVYQNESKQALCHFTRALQLADPEAQNNVAIKAGKYYENGQYQKALQILNIKTTPEQLRRMIIAGCKNWGVLQASGTIGATP